MPQIIPIRDLKNTAEISEKCHASQEPLFVTKNGYGDMVIMSIESYERISYMNDVHNKLEQAEESIRNNNVMPAKDSVRNMRDKYGL